MKKIVLILSILILLSSTFALSEHKDKSIELYPFLSYEAFDGNTSLNNTFLHGIRLGFNFSETMEGEFLYSVGKTDANTYSILYIYPIYFYEVKQMVQEDDEISQWSFNFIYNFKTARENIVPYALIGAGRFRIVRELDIYNAVTGQPIYDYIDPETWKLIPIPRRDSQSSPSFTLGGGIRSFFSKRFAFRFEVRAIQYKHNISGLTYDTDTYDYTFKLTDDDFLNYEASLGLSFFFGGKE